MRLKERLDLVIKHLGISGRAFAKECGFSESYYATINEGIGADKLNKILSRYPELSARWILTGEGEMLDNDNPVRERSEDFFKKKLMEFFQRRDEQYQHILSQNSEIIRQNGEILKRVFESQNKDR